MFLSHNQRIFFLILTFVEFYVGSAFEFNKKGIAVKGIIMWIKKKPRIVFMLPKDMCTAPETFLNFNIQFMVYNKIGIPEI